MGNFYGENYSKTRGFEPDNSLNGAFWANNKFKLNIMNLKWGILDLYIVQIGHFAPKNNPKW